MASAMTSGVKRSIRVRNSKAKKLRGRFFWQFVAHAKIELTKTRKTSHLFSVLHLSNPRERH